MGRMLTHSFKKLSSRARIPCSNWWATQSFTELRLGLLVVKTIWTEIGLIYERYSLIRFDCLLLWWLIVLCKNGAHLFIGTLLSTIRLHLNLNQGGKKMPRINIGANKAIRGWDGY